MKDYNQWENARSLLSDEQRNMILQTRLVQLAFSDKSAVAIKAVEMLLNMPQPESDDLLDGVDTATLLEASARVDNWIAELAAADNLTDARE